MSNLGRFPPTRLTTTSKYTLFATQLFSLKLDNTCQRQILSILLKIAKKAQIVQIVAGTAKVVEIEIEMIGEVDEMTFKRRRMFSMTTRKKSLPRLMPSMPLYPLQ
jgi:hypothetical protein